MRRKIIEIDETKCDGCGQCAPACAEGAIQIVGGKARLVADTYCDGLGACLGNCPRGAIALIEREASAFDEHAVQSHLAALKARATPPPAPAGCPGTAARSLRLNVLSDVPSPAAPRASAHADAAVGGRLSNWPIQLHLVPPTAPFLQDADLLLVADCVPAAYAEFHRRYLRGQPVVLGCPKLDDGRAYVQKLAQMIHFANVRSIAVLHMEVPCCMGLVRIAEAAKSMAGSDLPIRDVTISLSGEEQQPPAASVAV